MFMNFPETKFGRPHLGRTWMRKTYNPEAIRLYSSLSTFLWGTVRKYRHPRSSALAAKSLAMKDQIDLRKAVAEAPHSAAKELRLSCSNLPVMLSSTLLNAAASATTTEFQRQLTAGRFHTPPGPILWFYAPYTSINYEGECHRTWFIKQSTYSAIPFLTELQTCFEPSKPRHTGQVVLKVLAGSLLQGCQLSVSRSPQAKAAKRKSKNCWKLPCSHSAVSKKLEVATSEECSHPNQGGEKADLNITLSLADIGGMIFNSHAKVKNPQVDSYPRLPNYEYGAHFKARCIDYPQWPKICPKQKCNMTLLEAQTAWPLKHATHRDTNSPSQLKSNMFQYVPIWSRKVEDQASQKWSCHEVHHLLDQLERHVWLVSSDTWRRCCSGFLPPDSFRTSEYRDAMHVGVDLDTDSTNRLENQWADKGPPFSTCGISPLKLLVPFLSAPQKSTFAYACKILQDPSREGLHQLRWRRSRCR